MARYARDYNRSHWGWGDTGDRDRFGRGNDRWGSYGRGDRIDRYDASYMSRDRGYGFDRGYDRDYRERWQTDFGDPYGDRMQNTPFRMLRGRFENRWRGYDRDMYSRRGYPDRYDRGRW